MLNILSRLPSVGQRCTSCLNPPFMNLLSLRNIQVASLSASVRRNVIKQAAQFLGNDSNRELCVAKIPCIGRQ